MYNTGTHTLTHHLYKTGMVKPLLQYKIHFATVLSFVTSCD